MIDKIKEHIVEVEKFTTDSKEAVEAFRIKYLGKKGLLNEFFAEFKNVANDQKKEYGQAINTFKQKATDKVNELKTALENTSEEEGIYGDLTRPGEPIELGARHPNFHSQKTKSSKSFLELVLMFPKVLKSKMIGIISPR